jgi:hypothetical protein
MTACGVFGCLSVLGTQIASVTMPAFVLIVVVTLLSLLPMLVVIVHSVITGVQIRMAEQEGLVGGFGAAVVAAATIATEAAAESQKAA